MLLDISNNGTDRHLLFEGLNIGLLCVVGDDVCLRFVPCFFALVEEDCFEGRVFFFFLFGAENVKQCSNSRTCFTTKKKTP